MSLFGRNKVACVIEIVQVDGDRITFLQKCPGSNISLGGTVQKGGSIVIYQNEIAKE